MKKFSKGEWGFSNLELLIIAVIVCILAALVATTYSGVQQKSRDTERKNDITKLQEQVEAYQAESGKYPTLDQLNSSNFRSANLKDLTTANLQDPKWTSFNNACTKAGQVQAENSTSPDFGCYGYAASPANCDNVSIDCTSYTLTANLEAGGTYVKKSFQ